MSAEGNLHRDRAPLAGRLAAVCAVVCALGLVWGVLPTAGAQSDRQRNDDEIDVLTATREEVRQVMLDLDERYAEQRALVAEARAAAEEAAEAEQRAIARVKLADLEVERAREVVREYAVEAYVNPPAADTLRVLSMSQADDAGYVSSVLRIMAEERHKVVDILVEKQESAALERERADRAAEAARQAASDAETQLVELDRTRNEQVTLVSSLDDRLDAALAEAAALDAIDAQIAEELRVQELALRNSGPAEVEVANATAGGGGGNASAPAPTDAPSTTPPPPSAAPAPAPTPRPTPPPTTRPPAPSPPRPPSSPPPSGTVTWNDVTSVQGIWVHRSIAGNVQNLLNAASAAGFTLRGGGFRDSQAQINTRRNNCGPTHYDIYEKPASQCSPPTAIPGRSMHERGLAIDFTSNGSLITSRSNPAFQWLAANAARFGLYNLPSEPWHWSTNGN
jgi:hypothetical protein